MRASARTAGFTLIEIMIVVGIIGVLASIAIPNFKTFVCKSRQTEAQALLKGIYVAQQVYANETDNFLCTEADLQSIGGIEYSDTQYNVLSVNCAPGVFNATMTSRFIGPGGNDVWTVSTQGTLVHVHEGCR
jgi:prepilin-type N-terminal cleavage/methylation domain-containing protein